VDRSWIKPAQNPIQWQALVFAVLLHGFSYVYGDGVLQRNGVHLPLPLKWLCKTLLPLEFANKAKMHVPQVNFFSGYHMEKTLKCFTV